MASLTMTRGDTQQLDYVVNRNSSAVDLTGAKVWFTAKNAIADADPGVFQKSSPASGITITNAALGKFRVTISPSDTTGISGSTDTTLIYDVQLKESDGTITTIDSGTLKVSPDVTITTT